MDSIKSRCLKTTRHIADKVLALRRASKLTQEQFAEKTNLDRRTIARAEEGIHRPLPETLETIAEAFNIPISYFYDNSNYKHDLNKSALIIEINSKLNILPKSSLEKILSFIDIIN